MLVDIIDIFWTPVPLVEGCPDELEHAGVVPHEAVYDGGRAAHVVHRGEGGHHGRHAHGGHWWSPGHEVGTADGTRMCISHCRCISSTIYLKTNQPLHY